MKVLIPANRMGKTIAMMDEIERLIKSGRITKDSVVHVTGQENRWPAGGSSDTQEPRKEH